MIPRAYITAWRRRAPWPDDSQVEQDLVLSRAIVQLFSSVEVSPQIALRGGTALHKLFLGPAVRYSEDVTPLLAPGVEYDVGAALTHVLDALVALLPGDPWKGGAGRR